MYLALNLYLCPQPALVLQCDVCRQFIDDEAKAVVALVGASRFHKCCCCHQEVAGGGTDEYKMRYASWERKAANDFGI